MLICRRCNRRNCKELHWSDRSEADVCSACFVADLAEDKKERKLICPRCSEERSRLSPSDPYQGYLCDACYIEVNLEDKTRRMEQYIGRRPILPKEEYESATLHRRHSRQRSYLGIRSLIRTISNWLCEKTNPR